ncbi:MAG: hypothetical protein N2109_12730 [Fimbriimonadales bacterium]|nr:hypothetical protein [Fimbriimonadales bacterium]
MEESKRVLYRCMEHVGGCFVVGSAVRIHPSMRPFVSVTVSRGDDVAIALMRHFDSEEEAARAANAAFFAACAFVRDCGPDGLRFERWDGRWVDGEPIDNLKVVAE